VIYVCITVINEFGALKVIHVFSITRIGTNITEIGNDVTCIGDITRAGIFPDCLDEKRSNLDFVIYFLKNCSDSFAFFISKNANWGPSCCVERRMPFNRSRAHFLWPEWPK